MKEIPLTHGYTAIVDDEDYEWLNQWKWFAHRPGKYNSVYAIKSSSPRISMHRLIMNVGQGDIVDHINRNSLDNRRENLRITTQSVNGANSKLRSNNTNGYVGVNEANKKWRAKICYIRRYITSGCFPDIITAALVRDEIAKRLWGDNIYLNFPDERPSQEIIDEVDRIFAKHGLG